MILLVMRSKARATFLTEFETVVETVLGCDCLIIV
jgi:hypothetical protein